MSFSKRNDTLYIDTEALSTLALIQEGLLYPVTGLMSQKEAIEVDKTKRFKGLPFPFSFTLSPRGKKNEENIKQFKKGQKVTLINNNKEVGYLIVDEVFPIDPKERILNIYGTTDLSIPAVNRAYKRLGNWAVSGEYKVEYPLISKTKQALKLYIKQSNAKKISAIMLGANPLTRAQERVIRDALSFSDLLIIFLIKPFTKEGMDYEIRKHTLDTFVSNYLPSKKVIVLPFENSYIFAGYNELILDALVAKNYGAHNLIVGKNHRALGMVYTQGKENTIFDTLKDIGINIILNQEYVYCNVCRTLVTTETCPHGQHHHIHYHSGPIMELINSGLLPPSILVRKEISAYIMASLFPNRFKNLQQTYDMLIPGSGLLEDKNEEEFYIKLMKLYQTTSLT